MARKGERWCMWKEIRNQKNNQVMSKKKDKDWPFKGGYNHLLEYNDGKPLVQGEGIKVRCIDRVVKNGKSLNK